MIKPLTNRVIIKPHDAVTQTASGLYIPDVAQEKPQHGEVVSCGPEVTDLAPGDQVWYPKHAGISITIGEDDLIIMKYNEILFKDGREDS